MMMIAPHCSAPYKCWRCENTPVFPSVLSDRRALFHHLHPAATCLDLPRGPSQGKVRHLLHCRCRPVTPPSYVVQRSKSCLYYLMTLEIPTAISQSLSLWVTQGSIRLCSGKSLISDKVEWVHIKVSSKIHNFSSQHRLPPKILCQWKHV